MRENEDQDAAAGEAGDDFEAGGLRALWTGTITFGLVTIPVELYAAQRRPAGMRMLSPSPEHVPLARQYYCPADGAALDPDDIARGYQIEPGKHVTVTDEELQSLAPRMSRDIDLQQFVAHSAIDPMYFRRAYYLAPSGSAKAYRLLADTMERTGRAGIARFVMRGIEYLVAIFAEQGILRAETLRHGAELRDLDAIPVPKKSKPDAKLARQLEQAVKALSRDELDEVELEDVESKKLRKLASAKRARGKDVVQMPEIPGSKEETGDNVIDIMRILKQRMAQKPTAPAVADNRRLQRGRRAVGAKRRK